MHAPCGEDDAYCRPDAAPDCFHTPVGQVTRIDPIPCERPVIRHTTVDPRCSTRPHQFPPGTLAPNPPTTRPSVWAAPEDIAAKLAEVSA